LCFNIAAQSVNNNCTDAIVLCDTSQIHVLNTPQSSIGDLLWQDEDNLTREKGERRRDFIESVINIPSGKDPSPFSPLPSFLSFGLTPFY
jgi:hypothetical protein